MPSHTASKSRTPAEPTAEKPRRFREVYETHEIPHLWAHQTQNYARNRQNNLYFRGPTIYSYRDSFPVARIVTRGKKTCVLLTTERYGNTTAGHISSVACSIPSDMLTFRVPDVLTWTDVTSKIAKGAHARNWRSYLDRIETQAGTVQRSRKRRDYELARLQCLIDDTNAYSAFFGLRKRVTGGDDLDALVKELGARQAEIRKAETKALREREAKRDAELAVDLATWLEGGQSRSYLGVLSKTYLRIRTYPDNPELEPDIETTKGATFPMAHAVKLWPLLKRLHDKGETYQYNGHSLHLGQYVIDCMDAQGTVTAGCHVVEWDEIERIAGLLGLS